MHPAQNVSSNDLELEWSAWSPATEYWIYGADNDWYFVPGFAPGFENKLDEVVSPVTTWSSSNGFSDPDHDWTEMTIAVDGSGNELARTDYGGEQDFGIALPWNYGKRID